MGGLIGSMFILHALLLALPLEYQPVRSQSALEAQTTPTCFQPALEAGEEERTAVELSERIILADPSLEGWSELPDGATSVVAAEAESASPQVAEHNTFVSVKSVISVGCGILFYVATL